MSLTQVPETLYARSGDVNIAYQTVGKGELDLVYVPGWTSNIEYMWTYPPFAHFLRRLAAFSRLILFDKRGTARLISNLDSHAAVGYQKYRGLKLTMQRRSVTGVNINANYTLSRCVGLEMVPNAQFGIGFTNPADPEADYGYCEGDRTHLANGTVGYQTPSVDNPMLGALASDWRLSGIVTVRSGSRLWIISGRDNAFNGQANQRPDQISDDIYGVKTLESYLNRAAFAHPANGAFGTHERNSAVGPGFWKIDLAVSRLVPLASTQNLELRLEVFNLLNNFNWGNPNVNFSAGTFGRITTLTGDPRILQFGVKYGF